MFARMRALSHLELPTPSALLERLRALVPSGANAATLRAELDDLLIDVDRETASRAELPAALARAALASGTALALLAVASRPSIARLVPAGTAFGAGVVGAMLVSYLGRLARERSQQARAHWSGLASAVRKQLSENR